MARKNVADQAKAKAAKQKKMAIILGCVLALAMAYAVHTMMSLNKSSASSRPQAAAPTTASPTSPTPTATPPAAPTLSAAPSTPTSTPVADTSSAMSTQLVNAVVAPADAGQLQSFSLFESKDPFNAKGPSSSGGSSPSSGSSGGTTSKPPKTPPAPPTPPPTSAVISVNGSSESVNTGSNFPASNPMFQLVSLTNSSAKVAVAGGSYANGSATVTLSVNKPVTLVNTADGTRYTITLMPQGTVATAAPTSSGTSTTPATTTTTSGG